MAVEQKILFRETEYNDFINRFPGVRQHIITNTTVDGVTTYYLESMKRLKEIQKKEGKRPFIK
ncbi:hypothetical protein [Nostoc sp. DSM 114159]